MVTQDTRAPIYISYVLSKSHRWVWHNAADHLFPLGKLRDKENITNTSFRVAYCVTLEIHKAISIIYTALELNWLIEMGICLTWVVTQFYSCNTHHSLPCPLPFICYPQLPHLNWGVGVGLGEVWELSEAKTNCSVEVLKCSPPTRLPLPALFWMPQWWWTGCLAYAAMARSLESLLLCSCANRGPREWGTSDVCPNVLQPSLLYSIHLSLLDFAVPISWLGG